MKRLDHIIEKTLLSLIEQAAPVKKETDNAPSDADVSPFTPAEEKFLGKFDAYGTTHIGIIYSPSDIGIREFITRSGNDLNLTPEILLNLIRNKIVKIVPYTGYGRNTDYTIELQLTLDDVKGLGKEDKEKAEAGSSATGAEAGAAEMTTPEPPAPGPEVAWVIPYGELIRESVVITKKLVETKKSKSDVDVDKSRLLKKLPKSVINDLERILDKFLKRATNAGEKQRLVADILDNLAKNLKLTPKQIQRSYEYHRTQKRLQETLNVDLNEHASLLVEAARTLNEIDESPQKKYLESQYSGISSFIDRANSFWQSMFNTVFAGFDWNETEFYKSFNTYVFTPSESRKQILIIEALRIIIDYATSTNQAKAAPAATFLTDFIGKEWAVLLTPTDKILKSVNTMLNSTNVAKFIYNEPDFAKGLTTKEDPNTKKTKILGSSFQYKIDRSGIGQFVMENFDPVVQQKIFFPTYTSTEVMAWVLKLLAPYQSNVKFAKDAAGRLIIAKASKPTFYDTLSDEQKRARAIKARNEINSNMKSKFIQNRPDGVDVPKIENVSGYEKTWINQNGYGYVQFKLKSNDSVRLYPTGKYEIVNQSNKILDTGDWYLEYNTSKRKWDIIG